MSGGSMAYGATRSRAAPAPAPAAFASAGGRMSGLTVSSAAVNGPLIAGLSIGASTGDSAPTDCSAGALAVKDLGSYFAPAAGTAGSLPDFATSEPAECPAAAAA